MNVWIIAHAWEYSLWEIQVLIRGYSLFDRPCWTLCRQCLPLCPRESVVDWSVLNFCVRGSSPTCRAFMLPSLKSPKSHAYVIFIHQRLWNCIFVLISYLNPYSQGRAGTTSMGVKGMMIDRRDLNPGRWRWGRILIHNATTATFQWWKTYAIHFLHRVYLKWIP